MIRRIVLFATSLVVLVGVVLLGPAVPGSQPALAAPGNGDRAGQVTPATAAPQGSASKRGGVTISPAFQQISLLPDKPEQTFDFSVTNNTASEAEFALSVVDFGSLDETGGVLFAGNAQKTFNYRYTLSPWVQLEKDRVVVPARSTEKVPITLLNKESLTPGGHYGAILVTPTDAGGNGQKVQIDQVASSLLFVKKQGGEVYRLSLNKFTISPHLFALPKDAELRFQNSGNVHVIPRGLMTLTDPHGRTVKLGTVNEDSGIALPETFRQISGKLRPVAHAWLPGTYKLTVRYHYDDSPEMQMQSATFVYLNLLTVGVGAVVLLVLAVIVFSRKLRRRINGVFRRFVSRLRRPRV